MVPNLTLPGSGQPIPQVGFGLWKVAPEDAADLVYEVCLCPRCKSSNRAIRRADISHVSRQ